MANGELLFAACYAMIAVGFFLIFGKGRWDMGRFAEVSKKIKDNRKSFTPIELTEGNVQVIFERCLIRLDSTDFTDARLFPSLSGYQEGDEVPVQFDLQKLLKDKKIIEYLYGQIQDVHTHSKVALNIDDYNTTYRGTHWTSDTGILLKFLYLGVPTETNFHLPFVRESRCAMISPRLKPTLSPKDPAFPAWWEQHKAEWED